VLQDEELDLEGRVDVCAAGGGDDGVGGRGRNVASALEKGGCHCDAPAVAVLAVHEHCAAAV
jgi:hypothetical protein